MITLVLWRLRDPAWKPSFSDLLEDARTCSDPATDPATVLAALRDALVADDAIAPRARMVAVQAQHFMASRGAARPMAGSLPKAPARTPSQDQGRAVRKVSPMRRLLADLRPAFLGG